MSITIGIDIGTSGTKALAIDPTGKILSEAVANYPCHHPKPKWSEQDPEDWWQATIQVVQSVVKAAKLKPADVAAIGLSGQMHGSVFLDKHNKVVRPALLWNDQRTEAECEEIEQKAGGRKRLVKAVANPALTGFTAPKILWLRNKEPRNFSKTVKVLLPKDEIRRRLTGEFATDVSDASGTLLLDVRKRKWSKPLLNKLELDAALLPKCYESEEVTGTLTSDTAKLLGLTTNCLVVAGAGDCAAGAVGNGIVKKGLLSTSLGTSGVVFAHSDEPQFDPEGRLHTFCHAVNGKWHLMGVTLTAAGALQWFHNEIVSAGLQGKSAYKQITEEAQKAPVGSEGLQFLPYLSGERTPHLDPSARGALIGITLKHTRGHITRAIMEGVTMAMRDSYAIMQELGVPIRQIRASGGGAKNPFWRQMQADIFGKPVTSMVANEGAAYGVALLASVGVGNFKNIEEACKATIKTATQVKPDAKARKVYNKTFPVFQDLYHALMNEFPKLEM